MSNTAGNIVSFKAEEMQQIIINRKFKKLKVLIKTLRAKLTKARRGVF